VSLLVLGVLSLNLLGLPLRDFGDEYHPIITYATFMPNVNLGPTHHPLVNH
jgi:hypothetical protein